MDTSTFWEIIATAQAAVPARPPHEALAGVLAAREPEEILGFDERFRDASQALDRWDMQAAAWLISGGCSDDAFIDFRVGLIAQGRHWHESTVANPDGLADHPGAAAGLYEPGTLFLENVSYAAADAYEQVTGDRAAFYRALDERRAGESFDFSDDREMRRRLPRLFALCRAGRPA
jgi:hypothetical protein